MSLLQPFKLFEERYSKQMKIKEVQWRYYRLGEGEEIVLFLPGALRRAAVDYEFFKELGKNYSILALDYPPVKTIYELVDGIESILFKEGISRVNILGQSYGGIIAQAFASLKPQWVEKLIIGNSKPIAIDLFHRNELRIILPLIKVISERRSKELYFNMIKKVFNSDDIEIKEFREISEEIVKKEFKKEDIYSHFSVVLSFSKKIKYNIHGLKVYVLQSERDMLEKKRDKIKYEKLYGSVNIISLGKLGHAAMITNCIEYCNKVKNILEMNNL